MAKPKHYGTPMVQTTTVAQHATFSPPLAMQKSVWDSIVNGNFIDAKIFAFSRRSREPGRVNTPKALFVNTHVLAAACGYFQSSALFLFFRDLLLTILTAFNLSNGIATSLTAGFPPDVESTFDMKEQDLDSDYDSFVEDSAKGDPAGTQPPVEVAAPTLPDRTVKTYVVKYTAYRTFVGDLRSLRCING